MFDVAGVTSHFRSRLVGVVFLFLVSGCAIQSVTVPEAFPVLKNADSVSVEEVEILALTEQMRAFVEQYVPDTANDTQKIRALSRAIIHPGILGFDYDAHMTLTAAQAFEQRQGNCLAFANLFVALARAAGLKALYQEERVTPDWNEADDVHIMARHVNILVRTQSGDYIVDIARSRVQNRYVVKVISDAYAKAQYFNNLGVDQLLSGKVAEARGYFIRALETAPKSGYIWSNLGVAYSRNHQPEDAKWAYHRALDADHRAFMAMNNLSKIHLQQGDLEQARHLQQKAKKHLRENPYFLLMLSDKAAANGDHKEAVKLLRKALSKKKDEHRLHFAIAKSLYLLGRWGQAEKSFSQARKLAPEEMLQAAYGKDLSELVQADPQ